LLVSLPMFFAPKQKHQLHDFPLGGAYFLYTSARKEDDSRIIELVLEWWALLDGEGVGLPRELIAHHLEVAVGQRLVADVCRIPWKIWKLK
jgi:hypothetical protein